MISTLIDVIFMLPQDVLFAPIWLRPILKPSISVCSTASMAVIFDVPNEASILLNLITKGHVLLSKGKLEELKGQEIVRLQLMTAKAIGKSPENIALSINSFADSTVSRPKCIIYGSVKYRLLLRFGMYMY